VERVTCQAIVLGCVDFGEADRVVTLLTDTRGRLAVFARGARKSRRRFAGVLEPFTRLSVSFAETRGNTFRLDRAEVVDPFAELREDIARVARASYAAELTRELCRECEPHADLFALLCRFLSALAREGAEGLSLMRFELLALSMAGVAPRLDACVSCGATVMEAAVFEPERGGLLCPSCAPQFGTRGPEVREGARALASLQSLRGGGTLSLPEAARAEARRLLTSFVVYHVGRPLKSFGFMREMGIEQ
jgi:DNA repair protein RecO (recombination protein O)